MVMPFIAGKLHKGEESGRFITRSISTLKDERTSHVQSNVDKEGANEVINDKVIFERDGQATWRICD
jgi:hypothetical protein